MSENQNIEYKPVLERRILEMDMRLPNFPGKH
jgi:hypothetical protein